jgi:hypothetical protein
MITATTIAPPTKHHKLGVKVKYHHRAAVARIAPEYGVYNGRKVDRVPYGMKLFEGIYKNEYVKTIGEPMHLFDGGVETRMMFFKQPKQRGVNKTVMIWPAEGEGIIIGLVRRGIGNAYSASGTGSSGLFGTYDDYEPGGFDLKTWVWLYLIKERLEGEKYIMAPLDAVSRLWNG